MSDTLGSCLIVMRAQVNSNAIQLLYDSRGDTGDYNKKLNIVKIN